MSKAVMQMWITLWFHSFEQFLHASMFFHKDMLIVEYCLALHFDMFWWFLLEYVLEWLWYSSKIFLCKFLV